MVNLYRTAYPPTVYMARGCSVAMLFRAICLILKYGCPVLICYFYVVYSPGNTADPETPNVIPGKIISFKALLNNSLSYTFPPENITAEANLPMTLQSIPNYYGDQLRYWNVKVSIPSYEASLVASVAILFNFTVKLREWANSTVNAIGSFTYSFPSGVSHVSCNGDLLLEQNEIINFRGSLDQSPLEISSYSTFQEILEEAENQSTLFYVDWDEPVVRYGFWTSFDLDLRIRVRDFEIWHSIPLVSSIESVLILYLSTLLFASLILDTFQGFVFRNGYIKTWAIPLSAKPFKFHGSI